MTESPEKDQLLQLVHKIVNVIIPVWCLCTHSCCQRRSLHHSHQNLKQKTKYMIGIHIIFFFSSRKEIKGSDVIFGNSEIFAAEDEHISLFHILNLNYRPFHNTLTENQCICILDLGMAL